MFDTNFSSRQIHPLSSRFQLGAHLNPPDMTVGVRSFTLQGRKLEVETRVGCRSLSWKRAEVEMAGWIWQVGQANPGGPPT